jgi:DNA primase
VEEYIHAGETDFITFKARLLLDDAQGDPIKRARLITDVVQSISLIPKAITRSVYLKECSRMFGMDEQMLSETAEEMRKKKAGNQWKSEARQGESSLERLPADNPATETPDNPVSIKPDQVTPNKEIELAEQELIRLMIVYGNETLMELDEETGEAALTVAGYMIRELRSDELDLQQPLLHRIFDEYEHLFLSGIDVEDRYFIQHPDPKVSSTVAGLVESKYVLSRIHTRNGASVKTEENNLRLIVPVSVMAYKNQRVVARLRDVELSIKQAESENDKEHLEELYSQYMALTQVKMALAKVLGKRIFH